MIVFNFDRNALKIMLHLNFEKLWFQKKITLYVVFNLGYLKPKQSKRKKRTFTQGPT